MAGLAYLLGCGGGCRIGLVNPERVTNQPLDTASHFLIKGAKQPVVDPMPAEMAAPGIHF